MLLFKPEHVSMILNQNKTETRRTWKTARVKVGNIYQCKTQLFGKAFATVKVTGLWKENLSDISPEGVEAEGYKTIKEYMDIWIKINKSWNPNINVWVIRFELEENLTNMEVNNE